MGTAGVAFAVLTMANSSVVHRLGQSHVSSLKGGAMGDRRSGQLGGRRIQHRPNGSTVVMNAPPVGSFYAMQALLHQVALIVDDAERPFIELDYGTRCNIERLAIEIGELPPGFPRELLHRYIFGSFQTLFLTPDQFMKKVKPRASIYWPNAGVNGGDRPEKLRADIDARLISAGAKTFLNTYHFSAGHGAHKTGGLGRMSMWAEVEVRGTKHDDWSLEGKAWLKPDRWDFDWTFKELYRELGNRGVAFGSKDLKGRERRTTLGSLIPGQPFYVNLNGALRVREQAGDEWATFSA